MSKEFKDIMGRILKESSSLTEQKLSRSDVQNLTDQIRNHVRDLPDDFFEEVEDIADTIGLSPDVFQDAVSSVWWDLESKIIKDFERGVAKIDISKMSESTEEEISSPILEMSEPPQSSFESYDSIKEISKEIENLKKWEKFYKSPQGKKDYKDADQAAKDCAKAVRALEAAKKALEQYDEAMGV